MTALLTTEAAPPHKGSRPVYLWLRACVTGRLLIRTFPTAATYGRVFVSPYVSCLAHAPTHDKMWGAHAAWALMHENYAWPLIDGERAGRHVYRSFQSKVVVVHTYAGAELGTKITGVNCTKS
jgi:hypothetical protein